MSCHYLVFIGFQKTEHTYVTEGAILLHSLQSDISLFESKSKVNFTNYQSQVNQVNEKKRKSPTTELQTPLFKKH